MTNYKNYYAVPPLSRADLRNYARSIREKIKLNKPFFDVVGFLESYMQCYGITYDYVDNETWIKKFGRDKHAVYNLNDKIIYIKDPVYEGACAGNGRDRFTIAHEIAHALLIRDDSIVLYRGTNIDLPVYRNPEWQADCLAGELLVPADMCATMSIERIMRECKVSYEAAAYQKRNM